VDVATAVGEIRRLPPSCFLTSITIAGLGGVLVLSANTAGRWLVTVWGLRVSGPGTDARRALGKLALFLAGVWALLFVVGIVVAAQGNLDIPVITWPLWLVPGFAFVPAAYFAVRLLQVDDPAVEKSLLGKAGLYAAVGLVLGIAAVAVLARVDGG
jgi:hypothetical protein